MNCCVNQWGDARFETFKTSNGVEQGSVISLLLFTLYVDPQLSQKLEQ